ncbi:MAG: translation initiation factor IF-6 [Candidatus Brockarchaeota archaeon]|nr:translation initiation factor IF-6 [Candidatus Brockarchaeota archaeon]
MLHRASIRNSPFIGVYVAAGGGIAIAPPAAPKGFVSRLSGLLKLRVLQTTVGGVSAVGSMVVMNSNGIAVPWNVEEEELAELKRSGLQVGVVETKLTSLGNLVCANDCGAIASTLLSRRDVAQLGEILGVEVCQLNVAGYDVVGSAVVTTNAGALVHLSTAEEERRKIQDVLKVKAETGTVNGGYRFVRAGIVPGTNDALVGSITTGPELMVIREALAPR